MIELNVSELREKAPSLHAGDRVLLSGTVYTARDAAHKRLVEQAVKLFGAEGAANMLAHAKELQAKGAAYCDCPACAACEAILAHKSELV